MGYWSIEAPKNDYCWGDQPAEIMDDAITEIMKVFKEDVGRLPNVFELQEGLKGSIYILELDETDKK